MMFLGELMCLIPYTASFLAQRWVEDPDTARAGGIQERRRSAHSIKALLAFSIPAACDACGSTLLNIGLFFTYASAFQMLRGSLGMRSVCLFGDLFGDVLVVGIVVVVCEYCCSVGGCFYFQLKTDTQCSVAQMPHSITYNPPLPPPPYSVFLWYIHHHYPQASIACASLAGHDAYCSWCCIGGIGKLDNR